jgi:hypothetical protein
MMNDLDKRRFIRQKATQNRNDPQGAKVYWSRHAIAELIKDDLSRSGVELALETCEVVEDYPTGHRPLPDCLVLAQLSEAEPVHAVIAIDEARDRIFVITVYLPSNEEWQDDWRTRK